jgi:hypothetical protein
MRRKPHATSRRPPIRRFTTVLIAAIAVVAVAVPALAASSPKKVDVPHKFRKHIPKVKERSGLPVLLPEKLYTGVRPSKVFPESSSKEGTYFLALSHVRNCHFANACFIASFDAQRGGKFSFKRKVKLTHGIHGRWNPIQCGASCAPAFIQWKQFGVLYTIEDKAVGKHQTRWMQKIANSAIRNGPR